MCSEGEVTLVMYLILKFAAIKSLTPGMFYACVKAGRSV